jgi:hypothetical protein
MLYPAIAVFGGVLFAASGEWASAAGCFAFGLFALGIFSYKADLPERYAHWPARAFVIIGTALVLAGIVGLIVADYILAASGVVGLVVLVYAVVLHQAPPKQSN